METSYREFIFFGTSDLSSNNMIAYAFIPSLQKQNKMLPFPLSFFS